MVLFFLAALLLVLVLGTAMIWLFTILERHTLPVMLERRFVALEPGNRKAGSEHAPRNGEVVQQR